MIKTYKLSDILKMEVICNKESEILHKIEEITKKLDTLEIVKTKLCRKAESIKKRKYGMLESEFLDTYGKSAEDVRVDYINLLSKCCQSCNVGHHVKVPGVFTGGEGHIYLPPKFYEVCKPTPLVIEAFETIGEEIWVDDQPHKEIWGN